MKYIFSGDRQIAVDILKLLVNLGYYPSALLIPDSGKATHANELIKISNLEDKFIFKGKEFKDLNNVQWMSSLQVDYIFGIHFPYIIPDYVLKIPKYGYLNLHPAYLPFNKGWHTPSWAIIDQTPYGATLHKMTNELDQGDIIYQKRLIVLPDDTANSLYQRVLELEREVFEEALPRLESFIFPTVSQTENGTSHLKKDIFKIQKLNRSDSMQVGELINRLRALTTNKIEEAAYFTENGESYAVQIKITKLDA